MPAAKRIAAKRAAQQVYTARCLGLACLQRPSKCFKFLWVTTRADTQLKPSATEGVNNCGVFGGAQRIFKRQDDDCCAKAQAACPL